MLTSRIVAIELCARGYHPVPLLYKTKKPEHASWQKNLYGLDDMDVQFPPDEQQNVGVLLGTEVKKGQFLMAIDIDFKDDQTTLDRVHLALGGGRVPFKRGNKGGTFFAKMDKQSRKMIYPRKGEAKRAVGQIEILGFGQQTVLPPSLHPETHNEYEWVEDYGPALHKTEIDALPILTPAILDEIKLAAEKPDSRFFDLNSMAWNGPNGGGNVHDTILAATGVLVAREWSLDSILRRCLVAAKRMLADNPHAKEWDHSIFQTQLTLMVEGALKKDFNIHTRRKGSSRSDMQNAAVDLMVEELGGRDNVGVVDGAFRAYSDGWWKEWSEDSLMRHVIQHPANWEWITSGDAQAVVSKVGYAAPHRHRSLRDKIMTSKGAVDLKSGKLVEAVHDDLFTYVLPIDYNPEATCPVYDKFVRDLFTIEGMPDSETESAVATFEEFAGLTFIPDTRYHKALILEGPPASGKSTILKVMEQMHDPGTRASLDLFDIRNERTIGSLIGRLVSFTFEIGQEEFVPADVFKRLADGSTFPVRRLYAEKFDCTMTVRMVIACNEMFKYRDSSGAMERRMIILKTRDQVHEKEQDRDLANKLLAESSGIFNRFVAGLIRLRERKHFEPPRYTADALDYAAEASDPVLRWVRERTYQGMTHIDPSYTVPTNLPEDTLTSLLYADFKEWLANHGHRPMTDQSWGTRLGKRGYPSLPKRTPSGVLRVRKLNLINMGKI